MNQIFSNCISLIQNYKKNILDEEGDDEPFPFIASNSLFSLLIDELNYKIFLLPSNKGRNNGKKS